MGTIFYFILVLDFHFDQESNKNRGIHVQMEAIESQLRRMQIDFKRFEEALNVIGKKCQVGLVCSFSL